MASEKKALTNLTPMDIHNKEFKRRGRKGYDSYEVDHFLDTIVDSYGDALDKLVDAKNETVKLSKENKNLQQQVGKLKAKVSAYQNKEDKINSLLVSAQKSANKIKKEAEQEADRTVQDAMNQARGDIDYAKQQKTVIDSDYQRLKKEIGGFRTHLQAMLQKQIDSLSDEEWQHALDKYFNTPRFYPDDGSEPLPSGTDDDDEEDEEEELEESDEVDKDDENEVDSSQTPVEKKAKPKPLAGDSPSHETMSSSTQPLSTGNGKPTIIFPDNYKDHN